jgi:hypothetical protein
MDRRIIGLALAATMVACAARGSRGGVAAEAGDPPAGSGQPVLLALGFSNASQEFAAYQERVGTRVDRDVYRYGDYLLVNGAFGNMTTDQWTVPAAFDKARQRIPGGDETLVRFVWFKIVHRADNRRPPGASTYVEGLAEDCRQAVSIMRDRYPGLQTVFVSGRTYGGWAGGGAAEPYAQLTWDAVDLCVAADPVAARGPFLWDPTWPRSYFQPRDGLHPSAAGAAAVAAILDEFFRDVL